MNSDTYRRVQQCRDSLSHQPTAAAIFPAPVQLRVRPPPPLPPLCTNVGST